MLLREDGGWGSAANIVGVRWEATIVTRVKVSWVSCSPRLLGERNWLDWCPSIISI